MTRRRIALVADPGYRVRRVWTVPREPTRQPKVSTPSAAASTARQAKAQARLAKLQEVHALVAQRAHSSRCQAAHRARASRLGGHPRDLRHSRSAHGDALERTQRPDVPTVPKGGLPMPPHPRNAMSVRWVKRRDLSELLRVRRAVQASTVLKRVFAGVAILGGFEW